MELAFKYYALAAKNHHAGALLALGDCYLEGLGTDKNDKQAVLCFLEAARGGLPDAYCRLAACYEAAIGVKQDMALATVYLRRAAQLGSEEAQEMLSRVDTPISHQGSNLLFFSSQSGSINNLPDEKNDIEATFNSKSNDR